MSPSSAEGAARSLARGREGAPPAAPRLKPREVAGLLERLVAGARPIDERYVILGELARGGMALVLDVWDTLLERPLAMKVLDLQGLPEGSVEAAEALERFCMEARIAAQLAHPGVVPIHDLGADEHGRPYFTMPRIEGRELGAVFDLARERAEDWSLTRALLTLGQLCDVMSYAHARGVLHRDLKPANVLVGAFGEIYVVDWGLAKFVEGSTPPSAAADGDGASQTTTARAGETLEGTVAGTPPYMAPEQAHGRPADVSIRTDVYALGALLYRLLAGCGPYASRQGPEDPKRTLELIRRGPPTPLRRLAPSAPAELVAICEQAMAREPAARHASVSALARELQGFLEARVSAAGGRGILSALKARMRRRPRPGSAAERRA